MKKIAIKNLFFRLIVTICFFVCLLLVIILNPILSYGKKVLHNNYTIYHKNKINASLLNALDEATAIIKTNELYDSTFKLDICLNESAVYTKTIEIIQGKAFANGFYNKVVIHGDIDYNNSTLLLNGYKWNLTELLAHEIIHCLQFNKLGFFNSNPVANIPNWKWEGYAEYIARNKYGDLKTNITIYNKQKKNDSWAINLPDGTISPKDYYYNWLLVQYCIDVKKLNFQHLLSDKINLKQIENEMMTWYISH